jgi:DNA-3-methyladenine glycosylase
MTRIISAAELQAGDTVATARWLVGKALVRTVNGERKSLLITEVEAYVGEKDLACHASKGRTPRTEVMYRPGGVWYVYLCYGIHEMLNLVVGPEGRPEAILIRGVQGIIGPGRVTKQLAVDRTLNGSLAEPASGLHLEDHGVIIPRRRILAGPRVGIDYAGPVWAAKPWRFQVAAADLHALQKEKA